MFKGYCSQIDPYVIQEISLNASGPQSLVWMSSGLLLLAKHKLMSWAQSHSTFLHAVFFFLSPADSFVHINSYGAAEHPGENEVKPLHCLPDSPCGTERRGPQAAASYRTHTTVLVTPRTQRSQWLGRYIDKIAHSPAASPFPTFIKRRASCELYIQCSMSAMMSAGHGRHVFPEQCR